MNKPLIIISSVVVVLVGWAMMSVISMSDAKGTAYKLPRSAYAAPRGTPGAGNTASVASVRIISDNISASVKIK